MLALVAGCSGGEGTSAVPVNPVAGDLLIAEFYYSGAPPEGGADHYFSDQFVELVNTTGAPLDLSGVRVGDAYGVAGAINPGTQPDSFASERPDEVVLSSVWRIPDGTTLAPGASMVLAHDGTNPQAVLSSIDLSGAAFETYVAHSGGDDDHPTVDNLEAVVFNGGFDWLVPVFGASLVVLDGQAELGRTDGPFGELATAPTHAVLDAVEALMDADSADFKRLPASIDAGFAFVSGTYTGQSLHRRRVGQAWQEHR